MTKLCYRHQNVRYSAEISRAELVIAIVQLLLGKPGLIIFTVVVAFACVTTAVALVCSVADHFAMLFRGKISYQTFVILFCVFSAVVANLGLDTIVSIAAPILGLVYPPGHSSGSSNLSRSSQGSRNRKPPRPQTMAGTSQFISTEERGR